MISAAGPPRVPPRLRPGLWALAGALVASAVWAGGLYAYGRSGPDLQGYLNSRDLCRDADLKALTARIGQKRTPTVGVVEHETLDQSICEVDLTPDRPPGTTGPATPVPGAFVLLTYTLHKASDPGPEFEASVSRPVVAGMAEQKLKPVPDLGERAYLVYGGGSFSELKVLDGQAELWISVSASMEVDPEGAPPEGGGVLHVAGIEPALIADARALMEKLKR